MQVDVSTLPPFDNLSIKSLSIQIEGDEFVPANYVKQYDNFYLNRNISGTRKSLNKININPKNDVAIQTILDLYSGSAGKKIFTAQELAVLASSSGGDIVLTYAEDLGQVIDSADLLTNLAKIEIGTKKTVWTFKKI